MALGTIVSSIYSAKRLCPINRQALGGLSFDEVSSSGKKIVSKKKAKRKKVDAKCARRQSIESINRVKEYELAVASGKIVPAVYDDEFVPTSLSDSNVLFGASLAEKLKNRG